MKLTVADIMLDDGRAASFIDKTDDDAIYLRNEKANVLIVEVDDFDDARELIATLERSQTRKSKKKVSSASSPPQDPPPGSGGGGARAEAPKEDHQKGSGADGSVAGAEGARHEQQQPAGAQEKKEDRGAGAGRLAGGDAGGGATVAPAAAKDVDLIDELKAALAKKGLEKPEAAATAKVLYRCANPDCRAEKRSATPLKVCPECGGHFIHPVDTATKKPTLSCGGTNCHERDGKIVHDANDKTCQRLRVA